MNPDPPVQSVCQLTEVKIATARFPPFGRRLSLKVGISRRKYTHSNLPQNRITAPILAAPLKCSSEHFLYRPLTSPAAPAPRSANNSSASAGTSSSPTTKAAHRQFVFTIPKVLRGIFLHRFLHALREATLISPQKLANYIL
jgi:hypothetical protein